MTTQLVAYHLLYLLLLPIFCVLYCIAYCKDTEKEKKLLVPRQSAAADVFSFSFDANAGVFCFVWLSVSGYSTRLAAARRRRALLVLLCALCSLCARAQLIVWRELCD